MLAHEVGSAEDERLSGIGETGNCGILTFAV
jgi:hypothetical protein